ncbi:MAG TPA: hypothetical protein VES42_16280 [Pilimelia sp.]|nr:hypothetical protein [Pilimelia sp.]
MSSTTSKPRGARASGPRSYADAVAKAGDLLRQGRLNDPDEHFPYKHQAVSELIAEDPPARPDPVGDPGDDRRISDYISQDIADASQAMIEAQAAHLADASDEGLRQAYEDSKTALVQARQAHRANRRAVAIGGRARRAGE